MSSFLSKAVVTGAACMALLSAASVRSQPSPVVNLVADHAGSIDGTILPPLQAPNKSLDGITVTITETSQIATVDRNGHYSFASVAPGTYTLVAAGEGFSHLRITDVAVKPDASITLGAEAMAYIVKDGELQTMAEIVVNGNKELMDKYVVTETKPEPFSDRNVDLPRSQDDIQPYYIFNSQQLEESGTTDVEDFLRQRLTMDTTVQTNSQITHYQIGANAFNNTSTNSSISLNGLGASHTLILVNGLPMAGVNVFNSPGQSSQPGQPDVNGIPLAAIDRIEVLPSSAGAIYGAGAEGGVINIVLKKAYSGGEITATYGSTWDGNGPSRTIEANFGKSFEHGKTQLFITAQYSDSSPMFVGDRQNLLNRAYNILARTDPAYLGIKAANSTTNQYYPQIGATPNIASDTANFQFPVGSIPDPTYAYLGYYDVPQGTAGAVGPYNGNYLLLAPSTYVPLTLKSTGALLGGSNPYIATLPVGYGPNSNPTNIIGGQWNLAPNPSNEGPNGLLVPLANYPRRKSIMATLTRQMTSKLELHADFSNEENHSYSSFNPIGTQNGVVIPASSPVNPFNQAVLISFPINYNAPAVSTTISNVVTVGGTLKLPFDWTTHVDYQWSESSFESYFDSGTLNTSPWTFNTPTFGGTYLGVPDNNATPLWSGAFNPFVDTLAHPINFSPFTFNGFDTGRTTSNDLVLAASGPIFHLPWGSPRLSVRLEHNKTGEPKGGSAGSAPTTTPYLGLPIDTLNLWSIWTSFGQAESTDSANAELDLPIFKTKWLFLRSLDAQLNFSNETSTIWTGTPGTVTAPPYAYGTGTNGGVYLEGPNSLGSGQQLISPITYSTGQVLPATSAQPVRTKAVNSNTGFTGPTLAYRPTEQLLLRGSVATGYIAPTYSQLIPTPLNALTPTLTNNLVDPTTGAVINGVQVYNIGGNPKLQPQTSKSWDIGAVWEPKAGIWKGLRLDAEFSETKQQNLILGSPGAQTLINLERDFPDLVMRSSSGQITTVYNQAINVAEARQDAWSFSLDYPWRTAIGAFDLNAAETIQEHDGQQIKAGTQFLEYVGYPNSGGIAKTKATATLRWAWHNWVAAWTTVFFDGYKQYGAPGDPGAYASQLENNTPVATLNTKYILPQGGLTIPSQIYQNLYVSYTFHKALVERASRLRQWTAALLDNTRVSLNVNNVLNSLPPFDAYYQPFYTSPFGDTQLRNYSVSVRKSW